MIGPVLFPLFLFEQRGNGDFFLSPPFLPAATSLVPMATYFLLVSLLHRVGLYVLFPVVCVPCLEGLVPQTSGLSLQCSSEIGSETVSREYPQILLLLFLGAIASAPPSGAPDECPHASSSRFLLFFPITTSKDRAIEIRELFFSPVLLSDQRCRLRAR